MEINLPLEIGNQLKLALLKKIDYYIKDKWMVNLNKGVHLIQDKSLETTL